MPTPAARATSSVAAVTPLVATTCWAASSRAARLRRAAARCGRGVVIAGPVGQAERVVRSVETEPRLRYYGGGCHDREPDRDRHPLPQCDRRGAVGRDGRLLR